MSESSKILLLVLTIFMLTHGAVAAGNGIEQSKVYSYVTRLPPGVDIMQTLIHILREKSHHAVTIVSAVGSVLNCYLELHNSAQLIKYDKILDIVSITGTIDKNLDIDILATFVDVSGSTFAAKIPSISRRQAEQKKNHSQHN